MKIKVNDMTCNHCVAKIQKELIFNQIKGKIDLPTKTVEVPDLDAEKAVLVIKKAGYTPLT
jgi:copper chaperone CopZ